MPPKGFCAVIGRPKITSMDIFLEFCFHNVVDILGVLVSKQIAGGLGAVTGKDPHKFLKKLTNFEKSFISDIGTAFDCHAMINIFKIEK